VRKADRPDSGDQYDPGGVMSITEILEGFDHALTASELARLLNVNPLTIYRQAKASRLPCFRIGSAVRFDGHAVARFLRERGFEK
jgi:excisionase family DNA binding protein